MKCEDFYAIGVVTYVERENSEAIRKMLFDVLNFEIESSFLRPKQ